MKNLFIIVFLFLCLLSRTKAQTYELKEIRTAMDSLGTIYEIVIEIKEVETGNSFSYGLPKTEWLKTEDEKVSYTIAKYKDIKLLEALKIETKTIEPSVIIQKRSKIYK